MSLATVLACHVLASIGVGPIFTLPFLTNTPTALHTVLVMLRFGAGLTLLSGILLWRMLEPVHPLWLSISSGLFLIVIVSIALVLSPAAERIANEPKMRGRVRAIGIFSSALTAGIAVLMVLRPGAS